MEDQLLEELPILDVEGTVEPEIVCDARHILRPCRLPGEELCRVGRDDVEDDVRHDRDGEEENDRPENTADEVADHVGLVPVAGFVTVI